MHLFDEALLELETDGLLHVDTQMALAVESIFVSSSITLEELQNLINSEEYQCPNQ